MHVLLHLAARLLCAALALLPATGAVAAPSAPDAGTLLRSNFVPVEGGQLYVEQQGTGQPIVLIHGGLVDHRMWAQQMPELARHGHVVSYDLRGFGRSTFPRAGVPFSHVEDLRALLDELALPRATLIGLSVGGQIAMEFTLAHPDRVNALVLVSSSLRGYQSPRLPASAAVYELLDHQGVAAATKAWLRHPFFATGQSTPGYERRMKQMLRDNVRSWTAPRGAMDVQWPDPPAMTRLSRLDVPTLVIAGGSDARHIVAIANLLAKEIPHAREVIIPHVSHHLNMEVPDEFNRIVVQFLRSIPPERR